MPNHQITGQPNMLLHIPHASSHIPKDALTHYCVTRAELERQMLLLTDWHTDTLFELAGAARLLAPVNRFVVDVERFSVDSSEPMAKRGSIFRGYLELLMLIQEMIPSLVTISPWRISSGWG